MSGAIRSLFFRRDNDVTSARAPELQQISVKASLDKRITDERLREREAVIGNRDTLT